ncbi:MAG: hypothetical protein ABJC66_06455 [Gammaproteobacteria bacterium]
MATSLNESGIEVAIQPDTGCGNPCHPGHTCGKCEPFWKMMLETGRFKAYVPPTFAGGATAPKANFGGRKIEFAELKFRSRGSNS